MDTVFNITATHTSTIGGYACTQCVAITGANVVTLKDKAIKKLLLPAISTQQQKKSFYPKELCNNDTNFSLLLEISVIRPRSSTNTCMLSTCIMCSWLCR